MRRILLTLAVLLAASGVGAEELRDQIPGLLRSTGCAMPLERYHLSPSSRVSFSSLSAQAVADM